MEVPTIGEPKMNYLILAFMASAALYTIVSVTMRNGATALGVVLVAAFLAIEPIPGPEQALGAMAVMMGIAAGIKVAKACSAT